MCKLRDRTSHEDFLLLLIKGGIHPLKIDQFNFIASSLKRLFSLRKQITFVQS